MHSNQTTHKVARARAVSGPADMETSGISDAEQLRRLSAKNFRRFVPFLLVCFIISFLDRTNIGFAAFQMNKEIGMSAKQFGFAAGIFFFGYFLFEVPSNLIMQRVGARLWMARIMITWGLISVATIYATGPISFAVARFCLGLAEAGFVPGIFFFFTNWFTEEWRAKATATFLAGIPLASFLGAPLSGAIMQIGHFAGKSGWQWLFILEGAPAIILGLLCLVVLVDSPEQASWLSSEEKTFMLTKLSAEQATIRNRHGATLRDALRNPMVFYLAFINFCGLVANFGIGIWMPQIIKQLQPGDQYVGILSAIPYGIGTVAMLYFGQKAGRSVRRHQYVATALLLAALGLVANALLTDPLYRFVALCLAISGIMVYLSTFWTIPSAILTGTAAAGGLALIVSLGNLGGFVGPYLIGSLGHAGRSGLALPLVVVAGIALLGAIMMFLLGDPSRLKRAG